MSQVVCQVSHQPGKAGVNEEMVGFNWAEGGGAFQPYYLTSYALKEFRDCSLKVREQLGRLVECVHRDRTEAEVRDACFELAEAGHGYIDRSSGPTTLTRGR